MRHRKATILSAIMLVLSMALVLAGAISIIASLVVRSWDVATLGGLMIIGSVVLAVAYLGISYRVYSAERPGDWS